MRVAKRVARARRVMLANPALAPAVRHSLTETLARIAGHSPDGAWREDARHALEVLRAGQWGDDAWKALGVPLRQRFARSPAVRSFDRWEAS